MKADIDLDPRVRFLQPKQLTPSRVLYALHAYAVKFKKQCGLPFQRCTLADAQSIWFGKHWVGVQGSTKTFGNVLGVYIPCRITAVWEGNTWFIQVDSQDFDAYYGDGAMCRALTRYMQRTAIAMDALDTSGEPDPDPTPVGEFTGARIPTERRSRPGEAAAREAGQLGLAGMAPHFAEFTDEPLVPVEPAEPSAPPAAPAEPARSQSSHEWAQSVLKGTIEDRINEEIHGLDVLLDAPLHVVKFNID